jgi:hypothetical protein
VGNRDAMSATGYKRMIPEKLFLELLILWYSSVHSVQGLPIALGRTPSLCGLSRSTARK